jgi:FkbM family methyltransferase
MMQALTDFVKDLLLKYPAKILPGEFYLKLIVVYGWLFRLSGNRKALKSASLEKLSGIVLLRFFDGGEWRIVNPVRANRYIKGITHAGERLMRRYHLDLFNGIPSSFVDVGANVGELSYWFAQKGCKVFAFEPDPKIFDILSRNLKKCNNVRITREALAEKNGKMIFSTRSNSADSSLILGDDEPDTTVVDVARFEEHPFANEVALPSILKMDTEGYEPESLRGFGKKLGEFDFVAIDAGLERLGESTRDDVEIILKELGMKLLPRTSNYIVNARKWDT